jgi:branched-chain amino acid transport system ATP-binding protein
MLDEPSLGLAPRIVRDIFHILTELRASGVSILLVKQNARPALQVANYAYVMELGAITMKDCHPKSRRMKDWSKAISG